MARKQLQLHNGFLELCYHHDGYGSMATIKPSIINGLYGRKLMGVEPTRDTKCRTPVLKTGPCAGRV